MNDLLRNIIEVGDIVVFINDVIVRIETKEGHNNIVEEVLRKMAENDLFVKSEKYMWKVREIRFLEVMMKPDGVKIKKEKVQRVVDWPVPRNVKDVQKFLGLANYYKLLVKNFIRIAKLLYKIIRKDVKWNWRERQQKVFEKLKKRFTMEPVLVIPELGNTRIR